MPVRIGVCMNQIMLQIDKWKRVFYIFAPLFLTILCMGLINISPRWLRTETANSVLTPVVGASSPTANTDSGIVITAPATTAVSTAAIITAGPTQIPPTLPSGAIIELFGPPPNSSFRLVDTISFYWRWPAPLLADQSLEVYVRLNGQEVSLGKLDEPNVGRDYRWQVDVVTLTETAVSAQWFIRLHSSAASSHLLESETRMFTVLP